ncbi:MAG: primary-amine oxidase [Gaiella sp.]
MTTHPLDPLSAAELKVVAKVLRDAGHVGETFRFASVNLKEPAKRDLLAWTPETKLPRQGLAVVWNRADGKTYEAVVDVGAKAVVSFIQIPGVQPNFHQDEYKDVDAMLRTHPDVVAALSRRGVTDLSLVLFDVWAYGDALVPDEWKERRVGWCDIWVRATPDSNPYAGYIPGVCPIVDMNTMELLALEDDVVIDPPGVMGEYVPRHVPGLVLRGDVKPLEIVQREGPSFTLAGHLLEWQNWSLRIGFTTREGLVLHQIGYRDGDRLRPIAHRMSFAEMIVPYRDTTDDHYRRTAYDIGEWGLGFMTTSLELGCDCLGEIRYLDATLPDYHGRPYTITNAICIHEEDNAVLWKHVDPVAGAEVRRMRRLVVSFHATVSNYEYIVYWRFYQDGNIECEVRATGIMVTTTFPGAVPATGTAVDKQTYAPFHQHFIVARLDLDIDGAEHNTVYETHSVAPPIGPDNPYGLALHQVTTPLRTEEDGRQDYDWASQKAWKVGNATSLNGHGSAVSYKLVPSGCFPMLFDPESPIVRRAQVIKHQLWVTPHRDDELWPAGDYPTQALEDTGLGEWTKRNRPIADEDVVLWYVFGIHHITRIEEWPVMPADTVSFWLKPVGFFDRNPSLDVPPEPGHHCHP